MASDFIRKAQKIHDNFVKERDWEQFHSPKNIAMALSVEVSELMENFLWKTDQESFLLGNKQNVKDEIADVFCYLIRLADLLDVDIETEFLQKMEKNRQNYPIDLIKGKVIKHTELHQ